MNEFRDYRVFFVFILVFAFLSKVTKQNTTVVNNGAPTGL